MAIETAPSPFGTNLLAHLATLANDPGRLPEFRHWFRSALWDAEAGDDEVPDDILSLAYRIENFLAVVDSQVWTAEQMVEALKQEMVTRPIFRQSALAG